MKKMKRLFKVGNLNRIIIFISMVLFIVLPSYVLYSTNENNQTYEILLPCILMLGAVLGTGTMSLLRPLRTTLFYFIEMLIILCIEFVEFEPTSLNLNINYELITILEIIFCVVAIIINISIYAYYFVNDKKNKEAQKEGTNEDTMYDFLNARDSNKEIEEDLEKITENNGFNRMKFIKQIKFSRTARIVSFCVNYVITLIYFFVLLHNGYNLFQNEFANILLICLVVQPILFFNSLFFPKDYKYIYFYNSALFYVLLIIACKIVGLNPLFLILCMIILCLVFLLTLIVEGRTWMGANSD